MRVTLLNGLIGSAVGLLLAPAAAHAQYHKLPCSTCPKTHPLLDRICPKKVCAPTICPGACFGYFPTQWAPWAAVCPDAAACEVPGLAPGVGLPTVLPQAPAPAVPEPPATQPLPTPKPTVPPAEQPKSDTNSLRSPAAPNPILLKVPVVSVRPPAPGTTR